MRENMTYVLYSHTVTHYVPNLYDVIYLNSIKGVYTVYTIHVGFRRPEISGKLDAYKRKRKMTRARKESNMCSVFKYLCKQMKIHAPIRMEKEKRKRKKEEKTFRTSIKLN